MRLGVTLAISCSLHFQGRSSNKNYSRRVGDGKTVKGRIGLKVVCEFTAEGTGLW